MMKLLMHEVPGWGSEVVAIGHETESNHPYNLVLGGMLTFEMKSVSRCEVFLKAANDVIREGNSAECTLHDKAWIIKIRPEEVAIEYEYNDMGDDWRASFPLPQVCRAVKAWIHFLQMPESSDKKMIVDLEAD